MVDHSFMIWCMYADLHFTCNLKTLAGGCDTISGQVIPKTFKIVPVATLLGTYALVICNQYHYPSVRLHPRGNSGDFEIWSSKFPLKALSPQFCYFLRPFFAYVKQTSGISPCTAVTKLWSQPSSFPQLSSALSGVGCVVRND